MFERLCFDCMARHIILHAPSERYGLAPGQRCSLPKLAFLTERPLIFHRTLFKVQLTTQQVDTSE